MKNKWAMLLNLVIIMSGCSNYGEVKKEIPMEEETLEEEVLGSVADDYESLRQIREYVSAKYKDEEMIECLIKLIHEMLITCNVGDDKTQSFVEYPVPLKEELLSHYKYTEEDPNKYYSRVKYWFYITKKGLEKYK